MVRYGGHVILICLCLQLIQQMRERVHVVIWKFRYSINVTRHVRFMIINKYYT